MKIQDAIGRADPQLRDIPRESLSSIAGGFFSAETLIRLTKSKHVKIIERALEILKEGQ